MALWAWTGIDGMEDVDLSFLGLISYIGVIAAIVQIMEMFLDKFVPALHNALGVLPAIDYSELRHFGVLHCLWLSVTTI